jgi:hypothetical protein
MGFWNLTISILKKEVVIILSTLKTLMEEVYNYFGDLHLIIMSLLLFRDLIWFFKVLWVWFWFLKPSYKYALPFEGSNLTSLIQLVSLIFQTFI